MVGDSMDLVQAAEKSGLHHDGRLRGNFDGVYRLPQEIRVHGWAVDLAGGEVGVLVFHCGNYLGIAPRGVSRPDVAKALVSKDIDSGFTLNLRTPMKDCGSSQVDGLVLGSDGGFATFSARFE